MPTAMKAQLKTRAGRPFAVRRPSILELRSGEDPWIQRCRNEECLVLYIQAQPVAIFAGLALDLESLNARLFDICQRLPRRWV